MRGRLSALSLWLVVLAFVGSLGHAMQVIASSPGMDFYHYWVVGQAVGHERSVDIYSERGRERMGRFFWELSRRPGIGRAQRWAADKWKVLMPTATPFLYASLSPFLSGDYDRDRLLFNLGSEALFLLGVVLLCRRVDYGGSETLLMLVFLLAAFEPLTSDARVANVSRLQFAGLALYVWLVGREPSTFRTHVMGGVLLGLGGMFKPTAAFPIAALLLFWGAAGEWTRIRAHVIGILAGVVLALAWSSVFFGSPAVWLSWLRAASHLTEEQTFTPEEGNLSLLWTLERRWGVPGPAPIAILGFACAAGLIWIARGKGGRQRIEWPGPATDLVPLGVGCAFTLLVSPIAWLHYYLLAVFLIVWSFRPESGEDARPAVERLLAVVAAAAVSTGPFLDLFWIRSADAWVVIANAGLLVLIALAFAELHRLAPAGPKLGGQQIPVERIERGAHSG